MWEKGARADSALLSHQICAQSCLVPVGACCILTPSPIACPPAGGWWIAPSYASSLCPLGPALSGHDSPSARFAHCIHMNAVCCYRKKSSISGHDDYRRGLRAVCLKGTLAACVGTSCSSRSSSPDIFSWLWHRIGQPEPAAPWGTLLCPAGTPMLSGMEKEEWHRHTPNEEAPRIANIWRDAVVQ